MRLHTPKATDFYFPYPTVASLFLTKTRPLQQDKHQHTFVGTAKAPSYSEKCKFRWISFPRLWTKIDSMGPRLKKTVDLNHFWQILIYIANNWDSPVFLPNPLHCFLYLSVRCPPLVHLAVSWAHSFRPFNYSERWLSPSTAALSLKIFSVLTYSPFCQL